MLVITFLYECAKDSVKSGVAQGTFIYALKCLVLATLIALCLRFETNLYRWNIKGSVNFNKESQVVLEDGYF